MSAGSLKDTPMIDTESGSILLVDEEQVVSFS
jgi:hypothetical protein